DARKSARTLHISNHRTSEASSTRAAKPAVRRHSRPMPDASESRAQRYASTSRAGAPLGTGCHTVVNSPGIEVEKGGDEFPAILQRCPSDDHRLKLDEVVTEQPRLTLQQAHER